MTRVLVVEDEESYSDALAYMLRKEGFEVSVAATGPDALDDFDRNGADIVNSEVILTNIRVLAIDQAPKEKDGTNALIGKTVTLELKPEQTETLARARQSGVLSLALRSIADNNAPEVRTDDNHQKRGETINVIRFGVANQATMQK